MAGNDLHVSFAHDSLWRGTSDDPQFCRAPMAMQLKEPDQSLASGLSPFPSNLLGAILALRGHLGEPFSVSGAPWDAILAPRDHPSSRMDRSCKRQDFCRCWGDFGTCLYQFLGFKLHKNSFTCRVVSRLFFLAISNSRCRRLGLTNRCLLMEGIAKIDLFMEIVF